MRRLRVGFLTYGLDRPLSGVGRVALELGRALRADERCEVVYLTPYRRGPFHGEPGTTACALPGCARLPALMALGGPLIAVAARRYRLDVVHDPVGISPFTLGRRFGAFRRVVSIHDAIAFRFPEGYPWLNNFLHRRYVPATLATVDALITGCGHARDEIHHFLSVPRERVHIAPDGVDPRFRPLDPAEACAVVRRHGLMGPYVFCLGAIQARKNLDRLVAAFAEVRRAMPELQLAIAGPTLWHHAGPRAQIEALGLGDSVRLLGYVPDADLPALYSAARLFVLPSLYEGFGLPVLEAMACGTPVVCSNTTSLPEVVGDAALTADPRSTTELTEAMARALADAALRAELRRRGLARAAEFTWERTAHETIKVYQQVVAA